MAKLVELQAVDILFRDGKTFTIQDQHRPRPGGEVNVDSKATEGGVILGFTQQSDTLT